ncbi:MAG TPA: hypothetical protein VNF47_06850 [Streptosporangiaceae bacterium]|nr:hypothetical protein [Streptosporangiaceae bacterium]
MYLALIALFVIAILTAYQSQPTTSGRIATIVFFGFFIALFALGLMAAVRQRSRLQISTETILYVTAKDDTLTLDRQSGNVLRLVQTGTSSRRRLGLTNGDAEMILPISRFSTRELGQACAARGWEFPATIS